MASEDTAKDSRAVLFFDIDNCVSRSNRPKLNSAVIRRSLISPQLYSRGWSMHYIQRQQQAIKTKNPQDPKSMT